MINGKNYDFEDFQVFIEGLQSEYVTELTYSDEKETEGVYAAGSRPIAVGKGNYKASGSITFQREGYDQLANLAKAAGKSVFDFKPFTIIASYRSKVIPEGSNFIDTKASPLHTDTLANAIFIKRDFGIKQNDKENTVKLELYIEKII